MQNDFRIKMAVLVMSLILGFSVSCQKKTVAAEGGSNPTVQEDGHVDTTADTPAPATGSATRSNVVLQENIFFEFDKAILTPEAREALTKNGAWLRINADVAITIEGHCDERGTNEYNLALGDRRAENVKTFLVDLGIDRSRLTTISFGEERPLVRGEGEAFWAQNRRARFQIR
jgi:peptidoglycan-associated lipoprotein